MLKTIKELIIDEATKDIKGFVSIKLERVQEIAILSQAIQMPAIYGEIVVSGHDLETDTYKSYKKPIKRYNEKIEASAELFDDIRKKEWLYSNVINKVKKQLGTDVYNSFLVDVLAEKELGEVEGDKLALMRDTVKDSSRGVYIVSKEAFNEFTVGTNKKFEYSGFYNCYIYQGFKVLMDEFLTNYEAVFVVLDSIYTSDNIAEIELQKDEDTNKMEIYARLRQTATIEKDYISSVKNI